MSVLQEFAAAVRRMPHDIARAMHHWTLSFHRPEDVGIGKPMCVRCKADWPCDEFIRLEANRPA